MRYAGWRRFGAGLAAVAVVVAGAWLPVSGADADSRSDQVERQNAARNKEAQARSALEGVNASLAEAVLRVGQLTDQLAAAKQDEENARATLAAAQRTHQATQDRLDAVSQALSDTRERVTGDETQARRERVAIGRLARSEYLEGRSRSPLDLLLGTQTTGDFAAAAQAAGLAAQVHARELSAAERRLAKARTLRERQQALATQVEQLREEAETQVERSEAAKKAAENATAQVASLTAEAEAAQADLEKQKDTLNADIAKAEAEQAAAADEIARIDEENRRRAAEAARLAAQADAARQQNSGGGAGSPARRAGSMFASPLAHALHVTSPYGYRIHPILGYRKLHMGVDLASPCGEQQFASLGGRVVSTRYEGAGGNTVTINHGLINGASWVTKYRHMTRFAVTPGQMVAQGQLIGYSGATGAVTGCHVHFEIWKNGVTIDPMGML